MSRRQLQISILAVVVGTLVIAGAAAFYLSRLSQVARANQCRGAANGCTVLVRVVGQSMAPTLRDGQSVSVDTSAYLAKGPRTGDLVAFTTPQPEGGEAVRRIIAVPGDRLRIVNGVVFVNGKALPEPYLPEAWAFNNNWPPNAPAADIPAHTYFLLGDNRNHSADSRDFGLVDVRSIIGKVPLGLGLSASPSASN
jgi:signal peptidase I